MCVKGSKMCQSFTASSVSVGGNALLFNLLENIWVTFFSIYWLTVRRVNMILL